MKLLKDLGKTARNCAGFALSFLVLLKEAAIGWDRDKAPRLAASLAFYTFFSIAPLLVIVTGIAGAFVGKAEVRQKISDFIAYEINPASAGTVDKLVDSFVKPKAGLLATIIGFVVLFVTASGVFLELHDAMNTIWNVKVGGNPLINIVRYRLVSFGVILLSGVLMISWLLFSALLGELHRVFHGTPPVLAFLQIINVVFSYVFLFLIFASIFKVLPETRILWRDVIAGAIITAILFNLGTFLIGLYLSKSITASVYAAVGSIAILLLWIYYSAQIFFFGAEFTRVFAEKWGSRRSGKTATA